MDKDAQIAMLEEALDSLIDMLEDVEQPAFKDPNPQIANLVESVGEAFGYGALMATAEASWRETNKRKGHPAGGEHIHGPCRGVLQPRLDKAREALTKSRQSKA